MFLSKQDVEKFLPHTDPFLFIDTIESITFPNDSWKPGQIVTRADLAGVEIKAKFFISEKLDFFRGHFPGNPVVPGVLQIEMMAQAACFAIYPLKADPLNAKLSVALVKVDEAKFRKPLLPNTLVTISAKCEKIRGGMMNYSAHIHAGDELISEAAFLALLNS